MIDNPTTTKPSLQRVAKFLSLVLILLIAISLMGMQPAKIVDAEAKIEAEPVWSAYNDVVYRSGQPSTNITQYTIPGEGTSTGILKNYADGSNTPVTVTITESGVQGLSGSGEYDGSEANSGTDAYLTFHGIVDSTGLIVYGSDSTWWVDLTFTGLTAGKTYTFATTANRNRNESDYVSRVSRFTISDVVSATNASTTGVTVVNNETVAFSTGYNTVNGYVARWTGIVPGEDGDFKVRVNANSGNLGYGPAVFYLAEEIVSDVEIESVAVSDIDVPAALAIPDTSATVAATPAAGIASPTAAVTWQAPDNPFDYSTVYTASVTLTAASGHKFTDSTTATVNGQAAVVVLNGDGTLKVSYAFPKTADVPLTAITSVAVSDIIAPVALDTPDILATIAATPVSGITSSTAAVTWQAPDNPFDYSTVYTASVTLTAASGYEFTSGTTATVNGQEADVVLNGDGTLTISFTFPMTEAEPVVYEIYLPLILK